VGFLCYSLLVRKASFTLDKKTQALARVSISNMASLLPFVGTIDSDDEIEQLDEEDDSEEEEQVSSINAPQKKLDSG